MTNQELKTLQDNLWDSANNLRANSDLKSNEYATPVLGIIFLKFADNKYSQFEKAIEDEYNQSLNTRKKREKHEIAIEKCGFYLPPEARYDYLLETPEGGSELLTDQGKREKFTIDKLIKKAMNLIESYLDEDFKDILPKDEYFRLADKPEKMQILPKLLSTFNDIPKDATGDIFGKIYEYFLGNFAMAEGQKGGEFFTPTSVVKLIVEIIEPFYKPEIHSGNRIQIYDPACGSGGMFVQSAKFIENNHRGKPEDIFVYGQEKTGDTVKLAKMNILVNGMQGKIVQANSYADDPFTGYGKFDYVMANPPFNVKSVKEATIKNDKRFTYYGYPRTAGKSKGEAEVPDANYLWISLFATSLNTNGRAGFVMANSASDARNSEYDIRKKIIDQGIVEVMLTMPSNMFFTVTLPATLWFFDKTKPNTDRKDTILFIDARNVYRQIDRAHREFTEEQHHNLATIARLYRGELERFIELVEDYFIKAHASIQPSHELLSELLAGLTETIENLISCEKGIFSKLSENQKEAANAFSLSSKLTDLQKSLRAKSVEVSKQSKDLIAQFQSKFSKRLPLNSPIENINQNQHTLASELKAIKKLNNDALKQYEEILKQTEEFLKWMEAELKVKGDKTWSELGLNKSLRNLDELKNKFLEESGNLQYYYSNIRWLQNHFPDAKYVDITGLCKAASLDEVKEQDYSLNAGRYVGVAVDEDDLSEEGFKKELWSMHNELLFLNREGFELEKNIIQNIKDLLV
jgi:type I restriction enzyme M protein